MTGILVPHWPGVRIMVCALVWQTCTYATYHALWMTVTKVCIFTQWAAEILMSST